MCLLLGPAPRVGGIIAFYPSFESFTLLESVNLVKVFKLFRLEQNVFGVQSDGQWMALLDSS